MGLVDEPERHGSWKTLIDALEQVQALRDPLGRNLCLDLLSEHLGTTLQIPAYPTTRAHLAGIVLACRHQHPGALHALVEVLEGLEPGSAPVRHAREVVDEMSTLELVPETERARLFDLLSGHTGPHVATLAQRAAGPAGALAVDHRRPEDAIVHLEQLNARPDGVPPLLVFVEHLAAYLGGEIGDQLRRWCDRQAQRLAIADGLLALRSELIAETGGPPPEHDAYLVIRLERDPLGGDNYLLAHWRQADRRWQPRRGRNFSGTLVQIRQFVATLVEDAECGWAEHAASIKIEFLLPRELLSLPVDQWELDADTELPKPLGTYYQVVVRSLDRARNRGWHREWRRRWALLKACHSARCEHGDEWLWSEASRTRQLRVLAAKLADERRILSLVLRSRPAESSEACEALVGLRAGLPVMIWYRADSGRAAFEEAVRTMRDELCSLPERARSLRSLAEQSVRPAAHVGSRVTLLWDDPERLVEPVELPMAPNTEEAAKQ